MSDEYVAVYYFGDTFELNYDKGAVGFTTDISKKSLKRLRASINEALDKAKEN
jgi:hypothetical protein